MPPGPAPARRRGGRDRRPRLRRPGRLSTAQHRASAEAQRLNEQLSAALTSRVVIEQAKGMICERAGTGLAEAFARPRTYARNHNRRLTDVAQAAIDGTLGPRAWAPPPRPAHS